MRVVQEGILNTVRRPLGCSHLDTLCKLEQTTPEKRPACDGGGLEASGKPLNKVDGRSINVDDFPGIIAQMPLTTVASPVNVLDNTTYWQRRVVNDTASPGYYSTELLNGVKVELSATRHSGFLQYSFPEGEKHVLVDLSHYLPSETGGYTSQAYLGADVEVGQNGTDTTAYWGRARYGAGWNEGAPYDVYFCGEFDSNPSEVQYFRGRNTDPTVRYHTFDSGSPPQAMFADATASSVGITSNSVEGPFVLGDRVGVLFSWSRGAAETIKSRVGISFMSAADACDQKTSELSTWDLDIVVATAVNKWNEDVFSRIQVATDDTANSTYLTLLYSSLYFMHLMPSNRTGQNPLWQSSEPYWDDFCKSRTRRPWSPLPQPLETQILSGDIKLVGTWQKIRA